MVITSALIATCHLVIITMCAQPDPDTAYKRQQTITRSNTAFYPRTSLVPTPGSFFTGAGPDQMARLHTQLDAYFADIFKNSNRAPADGLSQSSSSSCGNQDTTWLPERPMQAKDSMTIPYRPPVLTSSMPSCDELGMAFRTVQMLSQPSKSSSGSSALVYLVQRVTRFDNDVGFTSERNDNDYNDQPDLLDSCESSSDDDDANDGYPFRMDEVPRIVDLDKHNGKDTYKDSTINTMSQNQPEDKTTLDNPMMCVRKVFKSDEAFLREWSAITMFNHSSLPWGVCYEHYDQFPALVMERVVGWPSQLFFYYLAYYNYREPGYTKFMADYLLLAVLRLLSAVYELHDAGMVHGQIACKHVIIDKRGMPHLIDLQDARPEPFAMARGVPGYRAPEFVGLHDGPIGKPADYWALGVVILKWNHAIMAAAADRDLEDREVQRRLRKVPGVSNPTDLDRLKREYESQTRCDQYKKQMELFNPFDFQALSSQPSTSTSSSGTTPNTPNKTIQLKRYPFRMPIGMATLIWYLMQPDPMKRSYGYEEKRKELHEKALDNVVDFRQLRRACVGERKTPMEAHLELLESVKLKRESNEIANKAISQIRTASISHLTSSVSSGQTGQSDSDDLYDESQFKLPSKTAPVQVPVKKQ